MTDDEKKIEANRIYSMIYDPVLIDMIRRIYPSTLAYDIIGVQPMRAPTGLIFGTPKAKTDD